MLAHEVPHDRPSEREVARRFVGQRVRALGVVSRRYLSNRYPYAFGVGLDTVLADLVRRTAVVPARLVDGRMPLPGPWYASRESLKAGDAVPRTVLLSPFDNLIHDRSLTSRFFGFDFRLEIYVPKARRRYGYFVMPILHGDRLIGRIDPAVDGARNVLVINAVYAEPDAPRGCEVASAIRGTLEDLAAFTGVNDIELRRRPPKGWERVK